MTIRFFSFLMLLFVGVASAHQQKEAYTTVLFNERTGNLEISHRFYIHDAEHALAKEIKANADLNHDKETQKLFTFYVSENFSLKDNDNNLITFSIVGSEVDGKYFWVYQETPITDAMTAFKVSMTALQDVWPKQINHINFEKNKTIRSVRMNQNDVWKSISLID
ncbi:MAG: DUF6702 family protein [Marinicellaceae bacterium]